MGYTIEYKGRFEFNKPLDDDLYDFLKAFAKTRHMKREMSESEGYGVLGEFYTAPNEHYEDIEFLRLVKNGEDPSEYLRQEYRILDRNNPPETQPGIWCQWVPTVDRLGLEWDQGEKFYNGKEWLEYLIKNFIAPHGYVLNGSVKVLDWQKAEYDEESCELVVLDNVVSVSE